MSPAFDTDFTTLDDRALAWLHRFIGESPNIDKLIAACLNSGLIKFGPIVFAICWLWFENGPNQERNHRSLVGAIFAGTIGIFLGRVLALTLPFRERPAYRVDLQLLYPFDPGLRTWSAFPSDHAVMAFALAASLYRVSPRFGIFAFVHAALVICFPRVYFGFHHPSDVIAGALIGVTVALAVARMPIAEEKSRWVLSFEHQRPAWFYAIGFVALYEITDMFNDFRWAASTVFAALRHISV
jgi:undecaprenyl-diphosphatase